MVRKTAAPVGNRRRDRRYLCAALLTVIAMPAQALGFAPVELPLPAGRAVIAVLDANGDELPDLAVFPTFGLPQLLLSRLQQPPWQPVPLTAGTGESLAVLVADVNNDGRGDLIVSRPGGTSILIHDGKSGFIAPLQLEGAEPFAATTASLSAGDVNGDGRLDVLESRSDGIHGAVRLWSSDPVSRGGIPAWRLTRPLGESPCCVPGTALLADLDNDRILDVLVAHRAGTLAIQRGSGTDGETARFGKHTHHIAGEWAHLDAGDVDNDGDLDLLLSGENQTAALYINDGGFRFRQVGNALPAIVTSGTSSRFVDFDSDGRLDIAWTASIVLVQQEDARFRALPEGTVAAADAGFSVADINGDGYPDVLSTEQGSVPRLSLQQPGPYHWLLVRLRGDAGRAVAGTRITAKLPDGGRTVRHLLLGDKVASSDAEGVLLGIRRHTQVNTVEVNWQSGRYTRLDEPLVKRPIGFIEPPRGAPRQVALANPVLEHLLSQKPVKSPQVCRRNYRPPAAAMKPKRKPVAPAAPSTP